MCYGRPLAGQYSQNDRVHTVIVKFILGIRFKLRINMLK